MTGILELCCPETEHDMRERQRARREKSSGTIKRIESEIDRYLHLYRSAVAGYLADVKDAPIGLHPLVKKLRHLLKQLGEARDEMASVDE